MAAAMSPSPGGLREVANGGTMEELWQVLCAPLARPHQGLCRINSQNNIKSVRYYPVSNRFFAIFWRVRRWFPSALHFMPSNRSLLRVCYPRAHTGETTDTRARDNCFQNADKI